MFLNSHLLADCGHNKDTLHCSNLFVGETLAGWQWYGYDDDDNDHVDDGDFVWFFVRQSTDANLPPLLSMCATPAAIP